MEILNLVNSQQYNLAKIMNQFRVVNLRKKKKNHPPKMMNLKGVKAVKETKKMKRKLRLRKTRIPGSMMMIEELIST